MEPEQMQPAHEAPAPQQATAETINDVPQTEAQELSSAPDVPVTSEDTSAGKPETPPDAEAEFTAASAEQPEEAESGPSWWDALQFEGKDLTVFHPDGTLALKATPFSPERRLQVLHEESASATIAALQSRFAEAENKVRELSEEWNAAEDKGKLYSKVTRLRDYLLHAVAIGDFAPLYSQVALWDNTLNEGQDKAFADRLALVEKAEALSGGEPSKEATAALREIGESWKALSPMADKSRADALWERLEAARNRFHDKKRERQEADHAEMLNNYDIKKSLADQAEHLAASEDWKATTQAFNELMDKWKATGRTFTDKNEALWQRFIQAKNVFYDRKRQHFDQIQTEQEANYALKLALVEEAEGMSGSTDWNRTSNAYNELMERWKGIGKVPMEKADELWDRLRAAKDVFYNARRQHQAAEKVVHDDNYAQKSALVRRAEELQRSTAWGDATAEFGELMEEWKKIGPVDHRRSQPLWEAFAKARRTFFARKDEDRDRRRSHLQHAQVERAAQAREFLAKLREELKEDEESLADYHLSLGNLTGAGKKDEQIRANLERLIAQATPRIEKRRQKIAEVEAQVSAGSRSSERRGGDRKEEKAEPEARQLSAVPETEQPAEAQPAMSDLPDAEPVSDHMPAGDNTSEAGAGGIMGRRFPFIEGIVSLMSSGNFRKPGIL